ncbi:cyclic pyranopterin monophosphate synthase MoaC [bacterium]|nr:cyclic pyranopterin monophosphate synthase MoaC [bacterium]
MADSKKSLTHLDPKGDVHMVDVGEKDRTAREAIAEGELHARPDVLDALFGGELKKGDALAAARVAGILASKRTPDLIPLCHPIATSYASIDITRATDRDCAIVRATVRVTERTGAEMEALTAASVALLTLYDMAKALQKDMRIEAVRLRKKTGGKSGDLELP